MSHEAPDTADKTSSFDADSYRTTMGSSDEAVVVHLVTQLAGVATNSEGMDRESVVSVSLALQKTIKPQDELEALLATQMVGVHNLAMKLLARANHPSQTTDGTRMNLETAIKMLRTFTAQVDCLARYRGKGQQRVTVEHVTVNRGGQAIVGQVLSQGGAEYD